jgi:hypothetical protein
MRSKVTVAIIAALLFGATLAADLLSSAKFSELSWIPASPHQLQVLALGKSEWAEHARSTPVPESWADTYRLCEAASAGRQEPSPFWP